MQEIVLEITNDGTIEGFADEILSIFDNKEINIKNKKRVSHILPKNKLLRSIFKLIRKIVSDESSIANWTRNWKCTWIVVINNKTYGEFTNRKKAIKKEKEIIRKQIEKTI